jgi:[acyl-carrier-protein] S-malonyltransferase
MAKSLIESHAVARELFSRASSLLGYDLQQICIAGPADRLNTTEVSQPAIFVASLAAYEVLRLEQPDLVEKCQAVAGLSLGEYTAIVAAGGMDFETALRVVQERGCAMQAAADAVSSGMVSILGLDDSQVAELCDQVRQAGEILQIANRLCPGNVVVSGHLAACERVAQRAPEAGAMKAIPLAVAGAFHTSLMEPAVERLRGVLEKTTIRDTTIPVVSNVDARPHRTGEEIRGLLVQQVVQPVLWGASMEWLLQEGFDDFYEIGPGRVLRGLLKRIDRKASCESIGA